MGGGAADPAAGRTDDAGWSARHLDVLALLTRRRPAQLTGAITENTAPCGSRSAAHRPMPGASAGAVSTSPPSFVASCTVASQSATAKYARHPGRTSPIPGVI